MEKNERETSSAFPIDFAGHPYSLIIRPLSDTVPLWSGSSFSAFVYVGNDGCMFCKNCKDKCRFPNNAKEYKKWEHTLCQILIPPK